LFAGADGLDVVRRLLTGAPSRLRPGGRLLIEIGQGQADAVLNLACAAGLVRARVMADLAGIPRVMVAERDA
jgi:release factor glutamine methyltransferase